MDNFFFPFEFIFSVESLFPVNFFFQLTLPFSSSFCHSFFLEQLLFHKVLRHSVDVYQIKHAIGTRLRYVVAPYWFTVVEVGEICAGRNSKGRIAFVQVETSPLQKIFVHVEGRQRGLQIDRIGTP